MKEREHILRLQALASLTERDQQWQSTVLAAIKETGREPKLPYLAGHIIEYGGAEPSLCWLRPDGAEPFLDLNFYVSRSVRYLNLIIRGIILSLYQEQKLDTYIHCRNLNVANRMNRVIVNGRLLQHVTFADAVFGIAVGQGQEGPTHSTHMLYEGLIEIRPLTAAEEEEHRRQAKPGLTATPFF